MLPAHDHVGLALIVGTAERTPEGHGFVLMMISMRIRSECEGYASVDKAYAKLIILPAMAKTGVEASDLSQSSAEIERLPLSRSW